MQRSTNRMLTTPVGSLVCPPEVREVMQAKDSSQLDAPQVVARVRDAIAAVVNRQAACGVDIPSDGAYSKSHCLGDANEIFRRHFYAARSGARSQLACPGTVGNPLLHRGGHHTSRRGHRRQAVRLVSCVPAMSSIQDSRLP